MWLGETAHTAEGLLALPAPEAAALTDAMKFLRAALADENARRPRCSQEATALGFAEMTLRRARKALGVLVRREGFGKDGRFLLAPPATGAGAARQANGKGNGNGFDHETPVVPNGFSVS